jgi:hypothetical protein
VNKSVSRNKTRRPRGRSGPNHEHLIVPPECVGAQAPDEPAWALCHTALLCLRCGLCVYHCTCAPKSEPPVRQPRRKRGEAHPGQWALCERPDLRYVDDAGLGRLPF